MSARKLCVRGCVDVCERANTRWKMLLVSEYLHNKTINP